MVAMLNGTANLTSAALRQELNNLRVWIELLTERVDELEQAYNGQTQIPEGIRPILPHPAESVTRYPHMLLDQLLAAEYAYGQSLDTLLARLKEARESSEERYLVLWRTRYDQEVASEDQFLETSLFETAAAEAAELPQQQTSIVCMRSWCYRH
jgi:hypothetical protein